MNDLISRQAAIDVIDSYEVDAPDYMQGWAVKLIEAIKGDIRGLILELPAAQPEVTEEAVKDFCRKRCLTILTNDYFHKLTSTQIEPLTDNEQRIFLAAMRREEKVCKQVDEEYGGHFGPYEDNLVRICHEITRKVKGALWTI